MVQGSRSLSPDSVAKWRQDPMVTLSSNRPFLYYSFQLMIKFTRSVGIVSCSISGAPDYPNAVCCRSRSGNYALHIQGVQRAGRHCILDSRQDRWGNSGELANWYSDPNSSERTKLSADFPGARISVATKNTQNLCIYCWILSDRYIVFYDQKSTLDALRFALPRDRAVNIGLHVLFQNDAFKAESALKSIPVTSGATKQTLGPAAAFACAR